MSDFRTFRDDLRASLERSFDHGVKYGAVVPVSLDMLFDYVPAPGSMFDRSGERYRATLRIAEQAGRWWDVGKHRNPFPPIDPTPRFSRLLARGAEARRRLEGALEVLRDGVHDCEEW